MNVRYTYIATKLNESWERKYDEYAMDASTERQTKINLLCILLLAVFRGWILSLSIPLRCCRVSSDHFYTPLQLRPSTDHLDSDHTIKPESIVSQIPLHCTLKRTFPMVKAGDLV
jgi:hypothetical protein